MRIRPVRTADRVTNQLSLSSQLTLASKNLSQVSHPRTEKKIEEREQRIRLQKEEDSDDGDTEDGNQPLEFDSARNSFTLALKDLNNAIGNGNVSSPRLGLGAMKKSIFCSRRLGSCSANFSSLGTPNYLYACAAMQKGWCSERVPLHTSAACKKVGFALFPFNNRQTLSSKWDDAVTGGAGGALARGGQASLRGD
ncbi:uncharacterized protein LOC128195061 [Vigna angularis]|uniref:uncharacterized protein LOC128195061 n=1 Tax=Phaseolus angularis TaxID=3914 RepID=UPI0022B3D865|nr:uncharacterized protein LOC128195061 [Vigna angularis]